MLTNRIILVIAGFVVAYFATWLGDGLHYGHDLLALAIWSGAFGVFGGLAAFVVAMICNFDESINDPIPTALSSAAALICACFLLGLFAGPITAHGFAPWWWGSMWDILPVLALVPMAAVIKDIVLESRQPAPLNARSIRRVS